MKEDFRHTSDSEMKQRLLGAIPGGAHTYSRGNDQYPSNAPAILESGKGAYVFTAQNDRFLDYGMGLRSVILGYADKKINRAVLKEIQKGNSLSKPSTTELLAAETLIDLIPSAQMVKFAKNGSNVTSAALKMARSFTGKTLICVPKEQPFFSFDDWFIGNTVVDRGVPQVYKSTTKFFNYGDIESLKSLFEEFEGQIAAVMLEPATHLSPCSKACESANLVPEKCQKCPKREQNFLKEVELICSKNGAVFILDEMRTGFRWNLRGAQSIFGVSPDLTTFGKAIANGFSVAALTGIKEIMSLASIDEVGTERTFLLSSTNGAEMGPLGALIATIDFLKENPVSEHLWSFGENLRSEFYDICLSLGIQKEFSLFGPAVALEIQSNDLLGNHSFSLKTLFLQEMAKKKVLVSNGNSFAQSYSHGKKELNLTVDAFEAALNVCALALEQGVEKFLSGPPVKPVFRKYN
jgi:glutamate-1-semialdehyde 2,1-aminomutase